MNGDRQRWWQRQGIEVERQAAHVPAVGCVDKQSAVAEQVQVAAGEVQAALQHTHVVATEVDTAPALGNAGVADQVEAADQLAAVIGFDKQGAVVGRLAQVEVVAGEVQSNEEGIQLRRASLTGGAAQLPSRQIDFISGDAWRRQENFARSPESESTRQAFPAGVGERDGGQNQFDGAGCRADQQVACKAVAVAEIYATVTDEDPGAELAAGAAIAVDVDDDLVEPTTFDPVDRDATGVALVGTGGEQGVGVALTAIVQQVHLDYPCHRARREAILQKRVVGRVRFRRQRALQQGQQSAIPDEDLTVVAPDGAHTDVAIVGTQQGASAIVDFGIER